MNVDDPDDPESFLRNLPPRRRFLAQALYRDGFTWHPDWGYYSYDDELEERDPYPEEGAYVRSISTHAWCGRAYSIAIRNETGNDDPDKPNYYIEVCDIERRTIAVYKEKLTLGDAARDAVDLAGKLERDELDIINGKFYQAESVVTDVNINEGKHKAGCKCGFCMNKGSFGKKKTEEPEKTEEAQVIKKPWVDSKTGKVREVDYVTRDKTKDVGKKKMTAESIVTRMLEDDFPSNPRRIPPRRKFHAKTIAPPAKASFYPSTGGPSSM